MKRRRRRRRKRKRKRKRKRRPRRWSDGIEKSCDDDEKKKKKSGENDGIGNGRVMATVAMGREIENAQPATFLLHDGDGGKGVLVDWIH